MNSCARAIVALTFSFGILVGMPPIGINAADPAVNDHKGHQPKEKNGAQKSTSNAHNSAAGAQKNNGQQYATRGNCTRCPPERIQKKTLQPPKPRNARATPQAKHVTSRKPDNDPVPLPDRCRYADPDEAGSEALKIECNKAGYPTPRWPTRGDSATPQPTSPPTNVIDSAINSAIQSGFNSLEQSVDEDVSRAHGGRSTCPSDTSIEQDAISGCHE